MAFAEQYIIRIVFPLTITHLNLGGLYVSSPRFLSCQSSF